MFLLGDVPDTSSDTWETTHLGHEVFLQLPRAHLDKLVKNWANRITEAKRIETNRSSFVEWFPTVPYGSPRLKRPKKHKKKLRFWKWTIQTSALRALTPSFNLKSNKAWAYPVYHSFTDLRCVNMCVSIFSCHKCFRLGGKAAATDWSSCGLPAQCVVGKNKNVISGKQLRVLNGTE